MNWKTSLKEIIFLFLLLWLILIVLYLVFNSGLLATIVGNVQYFILTLFVLCTWTKLIIHYVSPP